MLSKYIFIEIFYKMAEVVKKKRKKEGICVCVVTLNILLLNCKLTIDNHKSIIVCNCHGLVKVEISVLVLVYILFIYLNACIIGFHSLSKVSCLSFFLAICS